jgi:hypothetical protein
MSFAFKFNYQPHYAEDTKNSFSKHVFNKGYCPLHPDVLIKKGVFKIKRQECWRCLQQYNQQAELFYTKKKSQEEVIQEEVIQEEVIQEKVIQEKVIKEKVIQEEEQKQEEVIQEEEQKQEEVINKETEYLNEYIKIKQILFNFHYEIASPYKERYKVFRCKFCQKGNITREEFKVISLGDQNLGRSKHIRNQLPVCFNCNYNSSKVLHVREINRLYKDISSRESYVKKNNLVSLDEMSFIYNNIDKFIPIV